MRTQDSQTLTDFCARLQRAQHAAFVTHKPAEVVGRVPLLYSSYHLQSERSIMGLMPTGSLRHAHEHRLVFGATALDEHELTDWWQYALRVEHALRQLDDDHAYTIVSLVLAAQTLAPACARRLRKLRGEFSFGEQGWSSVRLAVCVLPERRIYTNPMGKGMKKWLLPLL